MLRAVVLAGGEGRRLRPYTHILPKPLMPLGTKPILEIVIEQLRNVGVGRVTVAVGHLAALIQAYFGDGRRFGIEIDYSLESKPLGTAGPLSLIEPPDDDFLVMNGDVLTDLDYRSLIRTHKDTRAIATLAVFRKSVSISLGVLDIDDNDLVQRYTEKPTLHYYVSTGIYCFSPRILSFIRRDERLDLPELVAALIKAGKSVKSYRFDGCWFDIGRPEDYELAQDALERGELKF